MWCGSCTLWEAFSELYNISCNKESSIADVMHFPNQRLHWDLLFSRAPQDWEFEHFYTFLDLINSLPLNGEGQDKLCWKPIGNKNFKVSEFYLSLSSTLDISFPWKPVWRSKVPPRVAFFSWIASLGKILTTENLWYKGVTVVDWCFMCKKSGESVNHILLHCPIAYDLWSMVWAPFGLQWVMLHGVSDLFLSWQGSFGGHRSIDLRRTVPHCVLWCIWQERNSRCFEGKEWSTSDLKSLLLHTLLGWSSSFNLFPCSNFLEMLDLCNLCV